MYTRSCEEVEKTDFFVDWGNGTSHRLLTEKDGMGFTVCHTVVRAGTRSRLQYRNHLEACYCIGGSGGIEDLDGRKYPVVPGTIYVLDQHDDHILYADEGEDMILVSVFNPPLKGTERHKLDGSGGSAY